jgi:hypothetical protein
MYYFHILWLIKPMPRSEDHSLLQKSYRCVCVCVCVCVRDHRAVKQMQWRNKIKQKTIGKREMEDMKHKTKMFDILSFQTFRSSQGPV